MRGHAMVAEIRLKSDASILACVWMRVLFGKALRKTTGFVESLLQLVGFDWSLPDFSTLSHRQKALLVIMPHRASQEPLRLLTDRTGTKVEREGEWNAHKHGAPKRCA